MRIVITQEDLRNMVMKYAGIDINNCNIDIQLDGYVKAKDYRLSARTEYGLPQDMKVITDSNMNVIDIQKTEQAESQPVEKEPRQKRKYTRRKGTARNHYTGRVDYREYETEVLDFATSNEDKRKMPTFGLTLSCNKERFKKVIREAGVKDMVRFASIDSEPYLVRITENQVSNQDSQEQTV